jgi:DNA-binding response OmpR family regulator
MNAIEVPDRRPRVLVAESDAATLRLLRLLLDNEGYEVTTATSTDRAAALLRANIFDLVITDSFSATPQAVLASTSEIREAAGKTPVILLTGHRVEPTHAGADFSGLLQKPFAIDDLITGLREAVGRTVAP